MSKKLNLNETKSPITLIYGEVKDIKWERLKGDKVSYVIVQTLNRRLHTILYYGVAPKQWLGNTEPRTFVVQEKTRVHTELKPFVDPSIQKAMGKNATLSFKLNSKEGHSLEKQKDELKPSEVYVKHKKTVTDLVLLDTELNPISI